MARRHNILRMRACYNITPNTCNYTVGLGVSAQDLTCITLDNNYTAYAQGIPSVLDDYVNMQDIYVYTEFRLEGFLVLNTNQNHMDPHFSWPWVQWTLCIDLSQADFSYQYHEVPGPAKNPIPTWTVLLPPVVVWGLEWSRPCHHIEGYYRCLENRFHKSLSKNHSFSQKSFHLRKWNIIRKSWVSLPKNPLSTVDS